MPQSAGRGSRSPVKASPGTVTIQRPASGLPKDAKTRANDAYNASLKKDDVQASPAHGDAFDFSDLGPPPDARKRELIFDSLAKIISTGRVGGDSKGQLH